MGLSAGAAVGIAGGVVGALVVAWHGLTYWEVDVKCEKPSATVLRTIQSKKSAGWLGAAGSAVEIRRYAPYLMAELTVEGGDMRSALSQGFRNIAGFIFGKNTAPDSDSSAKVAMTSPVTLEVGSNASGGSQKVAMTSPVTAEMSDGKYKISFIMPSKYTKDTLPRPTNPDVKIVEMPSRTLAVLGWRGKSPSEASMHDKAAELKLAVKEAGIKMKEDSLHLWQYHPPFAPSWMRKNEVLVEVEEDVATS